MAQFKPGPDTRRNTKGRPPGSTPRANKLRERINKVIDECYNLENIKKDLKELKPAERLNLLDKLIKHVMPPPPAENLLDGMSDQDLDQLIDHMRKQLTKNRTYEHN